MSGGAPTALPPGPPGLWPKPQLGARGPCAGSRRRGEPAFVLIAGPGRSPRSDPPGNTPVCFRCFAQGQPDLGVMPGSQPGLLALCGSSLRVQQRAHHHAGIPSPPEAWGLTCSTPVIDEDTEIPGIQDTSPSSSASCEQVSQPQAPSPHCGEPQASCQQSGSLGSPSHCLQVRPESP